MGNTIAIKIMQTRDKLEKKSPFIFLSDSIQNSVTTLNFYRLILATVFLGQILLPGEPLLPIKDTALYSWTSYFYLISALFWLLVTWHPRKHNEQLIAIQIYLDIFTIIIIMHSCGGVESGLGILLIINIIMSSLLCTQMLTFIFAALASLGLLSEYTYSYLNQLSTATDSTQVGLLGIALFATAFISMRLTSEIKQSSAIAEQKQKDLESLSALNDYIIETMQSGIIVLDQNIKIQHINNAACNLLHMKNVLSMALRSCHPSLFNLFSVWLNNNIKADHFYLPEESHIDNVQISFRQITHNQQTGYLVFIDDLSLIQKKTNQKKLAALGHLTANIAHEIRNPLGAISHASQLLAESQNLDTTDERMTEIIHQHTKRINHIIEDILQIARSKKTQRECIKIEPWLKQFIKEFCLGSNASIECFSPEINTQESFILFDTGHLFQVLSNICQNAKNHGIKNHPVHLTTHKNDKFFTIEIADEGPGMPETEISKITEPFYTTSANGSGLGLYIVNQLCDINSAKLKFQKNQYNGTSVTISCELVDE